MANPARVPDPSNDPRLNDPVNPVPPADPFTTEARRPANDRIVNRVETRSGGSSMLIAGIVLVLAVIAYFVFAPGSETVTAPTEPATTTTADPVAPAPDATAPAAPADPVAPAPDAAAPAPTDPVAPAPDAAAPAPTDPVAPAPDAAAPAPAQ